PQVSLLSSKNNVRCLRRQATLWLLSLLSKIGRVNKTTEQLCLYHRQCPSTENATQTIGMK
ncbi:MAG: hypothetical protein ACYT04_31775, partial [Nostoc sp.]